MLPFAPIFIIYLGKSVTTISTTLQDQMGRMLSGLQPARLSSILKLSLQLLPFFLSSTSAELSHTRYLIYMPFKMPGVLQKDIISDSKLPSSSIAYAPFSQTETTVYLTPPLTLQPQYNHHIFVKVTRNFFRTKLS